MTTTSVVQTATLREDVLRNPRYPVHQIADRLLPYLRVVVEQFSPELIVLIGSYAYGQPHNDSDVDLLIVGAFDRSPVRAAMAIRKAWRPVRSVVGSLPFDLLVASDCRVYYISRKPRPREATLARACI